MLEQIEQYVQSHEEDFINRLNDLLRIPSISTASEHKDDIARACRFVEQQLSESGLAVEVISTQRHPAVFADSGPSAGPTILIYGHYDVQPAGDLKLWKSDPFEPQVREGAIYGRGTADDKGQMMCHVMAVQAWAKVLKEFPCRVKMLIEGEEEIGSPSLKQLVQDHRERLACDVVVVSDTSKFSAETPAITYGTKGLVYKEIRLYGPCQNMHSGMFGGTMSNPGNILAALIAQMKDASHRITFPGFYDDVVDLTPRERELMQSLQFDEKRYLEVIGAPGFEVEEGYTALEAKGARPTLDVNGVFGGYQGEGAMTIIPAMCGAKVSLRIVPNQNAQAVSDMFDAFVKRHCPSTVRCEIDTHGLAAPYKTPLELPALKAAETAMSKGYGKNPVYIREGGTIPIMALFKEQLGAESVLMGFSDPNCNLHGPNEFFHIADYISGIRTSIHFIDSMGKARPT